MKGCPNILIEMSYTYEAKFYLTIPGLGLIFFNNLELFNNAMNVI